MRPVKDLLATEKGYSPITFALLLACASSGLTVYLLQEHSVFLQWTVLAHALTGIATALALTPYFITHIRRTVGFRRLPSMLSGVVTLPLFIIFAYSGLHLALFGQRENQQWLLDAHIVSALLFVLLLTVHLLVHLVFLPANRRNQPGPKFPSLTRPMLVTVLGFNLFIQVAIASASFIYQLAEPDYSDQPVTENYLYNYGPHPFRPSQTETSSGTFIDARQISNSHRCMACHEDIGNQWQASAHMLAASDPSYVTNVSLLADNKGITATRYCEGCHAPAALLTGELSPGGKHGGIAGSTANHEGIPCMGCHGIASLPHLKGVASYQFQPAEDYLFAQAEGPLLTGINSWLIRLNPNQHKLDMGRPLLKDPKICGSCHTQFMDKDMNNWGWVKMQDDYSAWLESPYSKQHEEGFASAAAVRCNDCHMPLRPASDPSADQDGQVRAHQFAAANTFLPLLRGDQQHLQETIKFLQSNKMRISIERPNRRDALQTLQALDESLRNFDEAPYYYYLGETASLNIVVSNNGVGHNFPGGTIDINEAWLEFIVLDAEGREVYSSGAIDEFNYVDKDAYFYVSKPIDRHGKEVWKHDLFNRVGEAYKRVVKAGESDIVRYSFTVPSWAKSPLTVTTTLKYRKLNERYARWALRDKYVKIPVVDMAWDSLNIPLRVRKEVESEARVSSLDR